MTWVPEERACRESGALGFLQARVQISKEGGGGRQSDSGPLRKSEWLSVSEGLLSPESEGVVMQ